jgi:hypothetical protein
MARFAYNNDVPEYKISRVQLERGVISGIRRFLLDYGAAGAVYYLSH